MNLQSSYASARTAKTYYEILKLTNTNTNLNQESNWNRISFFCGVTQRHIPETGTLNYTAVMLDVLYDTFLIGD
jgi:hypothetical protein